MTRPLAVLRKVACDRPVLATLVLLALVSAFFLALPHIDVAVSRYFYDDTSGFLDRRYGFVDIIRGGGRLLEWALAIGVVLPLVFKLLFPDARILVSPRATLFVLTSFALGPGLLVNGIFKNHWGRARPRQILDFGGDATFSPVWWISDQCQRNCSFVSGEASSAFWLIAIVFLVPKEWKWPVGIATLAVAALISLMRLMAGGHFLSDVLVAWLIVLLVLLLCHRLFMRALPPSFDTAIEGALARAGRSLRRLVGA